VLGTALWTGNMQADIAQLLLTGGANVNDTDTEGRTLLLQAICRHDVDSALFLLRHQADANARQVCLLSAVCQSHHHNDDNDDDISSLLSSL